MIKAAESAKVAMDTLRAVMLQARQRTTAAILPYSQWADLPRRKAAPMAHTRQCIRRAMFKQALVRVNGMYAGESRRARRNIARAVAKEYWKQPTLGLSAIGA